MGVAAGILVKFIFHIVNGAPLGSLFKANYVVNETDKNYVIDVKGAATFSNFLGYKKLWSSLKTDKDITFNFTEAKLVDHSFMEQLHHFEEDRHAAGSHVSLIGLDKFNPLSSHPLAARKTGNGKVNKIEIQLTPRQVELRNFADSKEFNFFPQKVRNAIKYKDFPIQKGNKILYEENTLNKYTEQGKIEVSDITLTEGVRQEKNDTHITIVQLSELGLTAPDFALEPEGLWSKFSELVNGKDIDFKTFPDFSAKYYLRGDNEEAIREFFTEPVIRFLENREEMHIECHKNKLLFYKKRDLLTTPEIQYITSFSEELLNIVSNAEAQPA
jgi:hypothetical protein